MVVNLIYASTSGNVETCIEFIANELKKKKFDVNLYRAEETSIDVIKNHKRFVFGTSTWDHGKINPFFVNLYKEMHKESFSGKQAAFIGLGDHRYEPILFCEGILKLRQVWLSNGGEEIVPILKVQGEPYSQLESFVKPWALKLIETWKEYDE